MQTPADFFAEDLGDDAFEAALATLATWAAVGERLGVAYAYNHVWPSSASRPFAANFDWHVQRLARIQAVLGDHGIRYGLEFLGPTNGAPLTAPFGHTIAGCGHCRRRRRPGGFLFDVYHWYCAAVAWTLYFAAQHTDRMVNRTSTTVWRQGPGRATGPDPRLPLPTA